MRNVDAGHDAVVGIRDDHLIMMSRQRDRRDLASHQPAAPNFRAVFSYNIVFKGPTRNLP
jgi:hypothetical protein